MDFEAQVKASLNTDQAKSDFSAFKNSIENNIIKIKLDTNFVGNNSDFLKTVQKQFQSIGQIASKAGSSTGQSFVKNISSSISKLNIDQLVDRLNSKGISKDIVSGAENSLNNLLKTGIKINKITESYSSKDGLISLKIDGIDEIGQAVSILDKLNKKTKEWTSTTTYATSFKEISKDIENTSKKLISIDEIKTRLFKAQGNVGSLQARFGNVDKFSQDFNELGASIKNALSQAENGDASKLSSVLAEIEGKVKTLTTSTIEWHKVNQTETDITVSAKKQLETTEKYLNKQKELQSQFEAFKKQNLTFLDTNSKHYSTSIVSDFETVENAIKNISSVSDSKVASNMFSGLKASVKNAGKEIQDEINSISKKFTQLDATTASNKTLSWLKNNSKAAKDYGDILTDLANKQRLATSADELKDYTKQVNAIKAEATALGKTGKSFGDEFSRAFKQIGQFAGIYGVIHQIPQIINQMYQEVVKVDTAQVELLKVSDAPTSQLTAYWDEAAESAKKYGAAISDVILSTADWSRLGYNLQDAKKLSDATTLLQRVGDNMTQESSSQGLISTLRGFSMQADEVNKIVDIANQVANTQPIDTSGLFEGLENSASSLSAANNSLEQSIGLITAANSVLQDPSSVGTGLKTISMRVRGASTELEKAGLDTDGMAESVAKLREEIKALSGVDIMIDDNNFKSTFDILDELSVKWKDLTDIQRASVTELIAGKCLPECIEIYI